MTASTSISDERDAAIFHELPLNDFHVFQLRVGIRTAMRFYETHDHIDAALPELVRLGEHAVRLADARGRANVDLELSPSSLPNELEKVVIASGGACIGAHSATGRGSVITEVMRVTSR